MAQDGETRAILFPGQGVGDPGDAELVRAERPDLLGSRASWSTRIPSSGSATARASPSRRSTAPRLAGFERLGRPAAIAYAGHSLGEVAALAAAGRVDDLDGLRIAAARGRLMQLAADAAAPGGMLAVGGHREQALELADRTGLALANENSPEQFVLSGAEPGLELARAEARGLGLRVKRLAVAGAFHSPDMQPVSEPFGGLLDGIDFEPGSAPVISGVTVSPFADDPRPQLVDSLTGPVRWARRDAIPANRGRPAVPRRRARPGAGEVGPADPRRGGGRERRGGGCPCLARPRP